jgi:hypothetical protein
MPKFLLLVVGLAGVVAVGLYVTRLTTVPKGVNDVLTTGRGDTVKYLPQIPDHVRKVMEQSARTADSSMNGALRSVDR